MTEAHAIQLCLKHRDPAGFEALVRQYRREAFGHALALLGNSEDAADACQTCFAKAFAAMPTLPQLDRFYPWFYRVLRNFCLNQLARRNTREREADSVQRHEETQRGATPPDLLCIQTDENQLVQRALTHLSAEHREVLCMKYFQQVRYRQIAETLGIPEGTVMSRLYHARRAFRQAFRELADTGAPSKGDAR
ncbi:MAG: RNA polymerase sigma factor [Victivallales bacterium]|nr:RNA polymerase sigma factor [Victivallales bacterium]MBT7165459.1 RNA polymerase sigma factor [Victivallales bacterium]MBT7299844.1 RNA polymerase sigma factor [Victivallales bacterium]